jgi:hypothetical protein
LVNRNGFSIHHVVNSARFCPVAFIFSERHPRMVNRWCAAVAARFTTVPGVNLMLNRIGLELEE